MTCSLAHTFGTPPRTRILLLTIHRGFAYLPAICKILRSTLYQFTIESLHFIYIIYSFFDNFNAQLPAGSYLTVEWPTNFGGINDYYTAGQTDFLWLKALALIDKFYYLSHTYDHPCTFDNITVGTYDVMYSEVSLNNINATTFFASSGFARWSNFSMITPCVTGLYNGNALQAMLDNGMIDFAVLLRFTFVTPYLRNDCLCERRKRGFR